MQVSRSIISPIRRGLSKNLFPAPASATSETFSVRFVLEIDLPKDHHPPSFPFYVDDFTSDGKVELMTTEEVGAYLLLLCKAWKESPVGSVPDDDRVLARWARMTPEVWSASKPSVMSCFRLSTRDGRYHQRRMQAEWAKMQRSKKVRIENARNAAKKRYSQVAYNQQNTCESHASGMRGACLSSSSSISSSSAAAAAESPPLRKFTTDEITQARHFIREAAGGPAGGLPANPSLGWRGCLPDSKLAESVLRAAGGIERLEEWLRALALSGRVPTKSYAFYLTVAGDDFLGGAA